MNSKVNLGIALMHLSQLVRLADRVIASNPDSARVLKYPLRSARATVADWHNAQVVMRSVVVIGILQLRDRLLLVSDRLGIDDEWCIKDHYNMREISKLASTDRL